MLIHLKLVVVIAQPFDFILCCSLEAQAWKNWVFRHPHSAIGPWLFAATSNFPTPIQLILMFQLKFPSPPPPFDSGKILPSCSWLNLFRICRNFPFRCQNLFSTNSQPTPTTYDIRENMSSWIPIPLNYLFTIIFFYPHGFKSEHSSRSFDSAEQTYHH